MAWRQRATWRPLPCSMENYYSTERTRGLGLKNLRLHNQALLTKVAAKLLSNHTDPCFKWIRTRYIQNDIPLHSRQRDTTIWRTISSVIQVTVQLTEVIIGNRANSMFWKDKWTPMGRFQLRLPTLFTFATHPNYIVRSQHRDNNWVISLQPDLSQQAASKLLILRDFLSTQQLQPDT